MHNLPALQPGDSVEIIAPASRCSVDELDKLRSLLESWQLKCLVGLAIFGDDLLCANTDEIRFESLKNALYHPTTKAIICARGGYGSMRILPPLRKLKAPDKPKIFLGMSDITAIHLFLQQKWRWPVLHGAIGAERFSPVTNAAHKTILFAETPELEFNCVPLNELAKKKRLIKSTLIGGNLTLVQASIGTFWQINTHKKIILLEDVSERGYKIDRMLQHLHQAGIFDGAAAVLLGDFIKGEERDASCLIEPVLKRFAESCTVPVIRIKEIGHGYHNWPLPLGTPVSLLLGNQVKLRCPLG